MENKWNIKIDGRGMSTTGIISEIFKDRQIYDVDEFLSPTKLSLIPFEQMKNIDLAAQKLLYWLNNDGKILVYFDSDTDGCTSGSIITRYLRNFTSKIDTHINSGKLHGMDTFDFDIITDNNINLLIIVDSIEDDVYNYENVMSRGCDIIVLDHHQIPDNVLEIQDKICLVSSANDYPNPALSGAGVAYKFCSYIDSLQLTDYADDLLDLSATGIIADMSSLGLDAMENRYICHNGIKKVNNPAIMQMLGSYQMNSTSINFNIAPLINAGNRKANNMVSMQLFLEDDEKTIKSLVKELKQNKVEQAENTAFFFDQMIEQAKDQLDNKCLYFTIAPESESIAGLLANKALSKWHKPVMVLRLKGSKGSNFYSGSMRGIGVESFADIINATELGQAFGHKNASGVKIPMGNFQRFREKIEDALKDIDFTQDIDVDVLLQPEQVDFNLVRQLKDINRISGHGFPAVKVMLDNITDYEISSMSDGKHLKINTPRISFIVWNFNDWDKVKNQEGKILSAIGTLDANKFGKTASLQMIMEDFKFEDFEI